MSWLDKYLQLGTGGPPGPAGPPGSGATAVHNTAGSSATIASSTSAIVALNVLDVGATGGGVSDDTAALQAAINGTFNGRSKAWLPNGTYNISQPLFCPYPKAIIEGESRNGCTIQNNTTGAPILQLGQIGYDPVYYDRPGVTTATVKTSSPAGAVSPTCNGFTMPNVGATTTTVVSSATGLIQYQQIYVVGFGFVSIQNIAGTTLTIKNLGFGGGVPSTVVPNGTALWLNGEGFTAGMLMGQDPCADPHGFGIPNFTTHVVADYKQPAVGSTVNISVSLGTAVKPAVYIGMLVNIPGGGQYIVTGIPDANTLTVQNLGDPSGMDPGHTIKFAGAGVILTDMMGLGALTTTTTGGTQTIPASFSSVNLQVADSTSFSATSNHRGYVWIQGWGFGIITAIPDSTHLTIENVPVVSTPANATGGSLPNGTLISQSGFTFECFLDPVVDLSGGAELRSVITYSGGRGPASQANLCSFFLNISDIFHAGNFISTQLKTTGGTATINSSSGALASGSLTHVAVTYDGANLRLFVAGNLIATTAATGAMATKTLELLILGAQATVFNAEETFLNAGKGFQIGSIRITQWPLYQASFTPPSTELTVYDNRCMFAMNFSVANRLFVQAPSGFGNFNLSAQTNGTAGQNLAEGWVIAKTSVNPTSFITVSKIFFQWNSQGAGYVPGQQVRRLSMSSVSGCIWMEASISGRIEELSLSGTRSVDMSSFSYNSSADQIIFNQQNAGAVAPYAHPNYWSWALRMDHTVQFFEMSNFSIGTAFNYDLVLCSPCFIHHCFSLQGNYCNVMIPNGSFSPNLGPVRLEQFFSFDDSGNGTIDCLMYVGNSGIVEFDAGLALGLVADPQPLIKLDGCTHFTYSGPLKGTTGGTAGMLYFLSGQTSPVIFDGVPYFANQDSSGNVFTGDSVNSVMPETGFTGQGVVIMPHREAGLTSLAVTSTTVGASPNLNMRVNDFMWKKIVFTGSPGSTTAIVLPNVPGYDREFVNLSANSLVLGGSSGSTVTLVSGKRQFLACETVSSSTGWVQVTGAV